MKQISTFFILLILTHFSFGQLSGTKYIPGSGGSDDYATFNAAITALNGEGVGSGGVTFNVAAGFVSIEDCPVIIATGTSSNPVIFQKSGSGNNPVIKPTGGSGSTDAGITIAGGDYITFDGIDIAINTGSAVEYGYYIRNTSATAGAQHNTIRNCRITLNRSNASSIGVLQNVFVTPTSTDGANSYNSYQYITIENAYQGIKLYSGLDYPDLNAEVAYCTVGSATANDIGGVQSGEYICGIRAAYCSGISVHHNEIRNVGANEINYVYGIDLDIIQGTSNLYANIIHDLRVNANNAGLVVAGLRVYCKTPHSCTIYNNMIYGLQHGSQSENLNYYNVVGMWLNRDGDAGTVNCYYNSVRIEEDQNPTSAGIYAVHGTLNFKNNILANFSTPGSTSRRYCIYHAGSMMLSGVDYNDYYIASGTNNFVGYYGGNRTTLADWQGATGKDGHSKNVDPSFYSATNLHTSSAALNEAGTVITGITTDIDGDARGNPPDIGADEYYLFYVDMGATALVTPLASGCYTSTETVTVTIKNYSSSAIDFSVYPVTVTTSVTGAVTQSLSATVNTGTLASGATRNVSMGTTLNMSTAGTYTFNASTSATGDANASNNAMAPVNRTVSASTPTPYSQNFDGSTSPPAGWMITGWTIGTGHANPSTGNGMFYDLFNTATPQFTLPKLGPVGATDELKFDYRLVNWDDYPNTATPNSPAWGNIIIYISSDCGVTYPAFATIDPSNHISTTNWATMSYSLSGYSGSSIIIRIVCTWGAGDYYADFDNFSIQPAPLCPAPSVQTNPSVSSVGATLEWTGPGSFFDIYVAQTTDAPGSATTPTVNDNPGNVCTWTGGSPSTTYYWWVRNNCEAGGGTGQSTWKGPSTFTTLSFRVISYPWSEGFEHSGNMPEYWDQQWTYGSFSWDITTGGYYGVPPGAHTGTYNARFFLPDNNHYSTILITPPLDLSGLTNPVLSFWHTQGNWLGGQDELKVHYKTSEGGSWQLLTGQVYTASIDNWKEEKLISLPAPSNTYYIGFEGIVDYGYGVCLDDVTVMESPACLTPPSPVITDIAPTTANLDLPNGYSIDSFFDVFFDVSPATPPSGGTAIYGIPAQTPEIQLTGLAPGTTYDLYLREDCGFSPNRKLDNFWMVMDDPGNLVTGSGTVNDPGETGQWLEYEQAPGSIDWWNIWFYNGPFVQENMKKIRMGFWVQKLVPALPGEVYFVINWSTPEWTGPGFPLPGQEQFIQRSPVNYKTVTESGSGYQWIELSYVISDYNPSWVSVDIWGKNIRIPEGGSGTAGLSLSQGSLLYNYWTPGMPGGIIVHECLPEGDQNTTSLWTGPVQFQTDHPLPYCESFSGDWPSIWTQGFAPGVNSYRWIINGSNIAGGATNEMIAVWEQRIGESWLASPVLEIPASLATLTFKHYFDDYMTSGVTMNVRYSNDGGSSWTIGWSLASGGGNAGPATVTVPINLSGDVIIQWYINGDHYQFDYWYIDDVCIVPSCDIANTWTGTISNSWTDPGNWSCGVVPGPTTRVIIPPKPAGDRSPVIAAPSQLEILSLDLMGEAEVTVMPGAKLTVLQP